MVPEDRGKLTVLPLLAVVVALADVLVVVMVDIVAVVAVLMVAAVVLVATNLTKILLPLLVMDQGLLVA